MKERIFHQGLTVTDLNDWWQEQFKEDCPIVSQLRAMSHAIIHAYTVTFTHNKDFYKLSIDNRRTYAIEWNKWEGYSVFTITQ